MTPHLTYANILDKDGFPLTPDTYLKPAYSESGGFCIETAYALAESYNALSKESWDHIKHFFSVYHPYMLLGGINTLFLLNTAPDTAAALKNLSTWDHDAELCQALFETFLISGSQGQIPTLNHVYQLNFHLKVLIRNVHIQSLVDYINRIRKTLEDESDRMMVLSGFAAIQRRSNIPVTTPGSARSKAFDIARLIDFESAMGITGEQAISLISNITGKVLREFNQWLETSWTDRSLDATLPESICDPFILTPEKVAAINSGLVSVNAMESFLMGISHGIQSLSFEQIEPMLADREVRKRPLIKSQEGFYLCSCVDSLQLDPKLVVTELANLHELMTDKTYAKIAKSLENKIVNLMRKAFPSSRIFPNVKWRPEQKESIYEVDLVMILDSYLLVIEAKSGRVTAPSHHGKLLRLKKDVGKLVDYASEQTARFIDHLDSLVLISGMTKKDMVPTQNKPGLHLIPIPLVVTHEQLGVMGANFTPDSNDNIRPLSVDELQLIMEILQNEVERLFYLLWRTLYVGFTDTDTRLLDHYLNEAFMGRDVHESCSNRDWLTQYHLYKKGKVSQPPSRMFTQRWRAILSTLDKTSHDDGMTLTFYVLGIPYSKQLLFENMLEHMRSQIAHRAEYNPIASLFSVCYETVLDSKVALCPCMGFKTNAHDRNRIMQECADHILSDSDAQAVIVFMIQDEFQDPDFTSVCFKRR
jgi:hypothetical protein